jgi:hypothetical protein
MNDHPPKSPKGPKPQKSKNGVSFDLQDHMYRVFGVDLTIVDGISSLTAQTLFIEIGPTVDGFATVKQFCSWLGPCPQNKISGGKILHSGTRKTSNKAAQAFRLAARSLYRSETYLGRYFRKIRVRHGAPKAITATAHKLARIFYHLVKHGQSFDETVFIDEEKQFKERKIKQLEKQAKTFGFQLVEAKVV